MKHRILIPAIFLVFAFPLPTHITATPNEPQAPIAKEVAEVRQRQAADLQALAHRLATLDDPLAILEVEREMADRVLGTQIELLGIRARHERAAGRIPEAEAAERAAVRLQALLGEGRPEGGDRP